jgi:hypothetical protein
MTAFSQDIIRATVLSHGVLHLTFADGLEGNVDALQRMRGPVFADACTPDGFSEVAIDAETGTIVWPNGADLAPDVLYERVRTGHGPEHDGAA